MEKGCNDHAAEISLRRASDERSRRPPRAVPSKLFTQPTLNGREPYFSKRPRTKSRLRPARNKREAYPRLQPFAHRPQEVLIRLHLPQLLIEKFHGFDLAELAEDFPQDPDPVKIIRLDQQLFLAGSGP